MKYLPPSRAWLLIGAFIVWYDLFCRRGQTLSEEADKWIARHPIAIRVAVLALGLHVGNGVPERFDVLHQVFARLPKTECEVD